MNRRRPRPAAPGDGDPDREPLAALHAEVLLLREENARLRGAQHQRAELARLLGRARALPDAAADDDALGDDAAQLLIDGLVIRESLLEICEEIERTMAAFAGRLEALASPAVEQALPPLPPPHGNGVQGANGHGTNAA